MLAAAPVTTILLVRDAASSVDFYRDRLGLDHQGANIEGQEMFALGSGHGIALLPDADATPTGRTGLSFEVGDITAEIRELEQRGVEFADYDLTIGFGTAALGVRA